MTYNVFSGMLNPTQSKHCTKVSPELECQGQRSRSPRRKKWKSTAFCSGVVLWGTVLRQFCAGGKIIVCCLVQERMRMGKSAWITKV